MRARRTTPGATITGAPTAVTSSRRALAPAALLIVLMAACTAVTPSGSGQASASPSAAASESLPASQVASATEAPSTAPSENLGEFACSFPVSGVGTVVRAQITDIRVGTHDGYDRVVFEFDNGIPEFTLDEATPPLL